MLRPHRDRPRHENGSPETLRARRGARPRAARPLMLSRVRGRIHAANANRAAFVAALVLLVLLATALALALRGCGGGDKGDGHGPSTPPGLAGVFAGRVVGLDGRPVEGAIVSVEDAGKARTDGDGRFEMAAGRGARSGWVNVEHPGFLPRA